MMEPVDGLTGILRQYRRSCPDVEPSGDFMPGMWRRIEARRTFTFRLRFWTRGVVTAAAALCVAVVALQFSTNGSQDLVYLSTYVEALDHEEAETIAFTDVVQGSEAGNR